MSLVHRSCQAVATVNLITSETFNKGLFPFPLRYPHKANKYPPFLNKFWLACEIFVSGKLIALSHNNLAV
ncbi:MAG: hypothetical protein RL648_1606 [Verrucomicrobiota bacterium]